MSLGTLLERGVSSAHVLIYPKFAWSMSPLEMLLPGVMRTLKSVKPRSVPLDVGANDGVFSLTVAQHCPDCVVYAVEPSPSNFRTLVWNIRRYGLEGRIIPSQAALAGVSGRATLTLAEQFPHARLEH